MDNLIEFGLFAVGFGALMRAAFHVRRGATAPTLLYGALAWAALMSRGFFYGPARPAEAHLGFGLAYALAIFGVLGFFVHRARRRRRALQDPEA